MAHWQIIDRPDADRLGEGPLWSPRLNALYWTDILGQRVHRLALADHTVISWEMPDMVGWLIERADRPGFIAGLGSGFVELELEPFAIRPIGDPDPARSPKRMNDGKADGAGRIYAGTKPDGSAADGGLYRLDPDFSISLQDDGYRIPNGPAIAADGMFLYHADSALGQVYRLPIGSDGMLGPRQPFVQFAPDWGEPDGMTIDAEGGLWIAHWGGGRVSRFLADGTLDRAIDLPASQITSCTFAGEDLSRMFVTSAADGVDEPYAGALFEVDPGVRGLPTQCFGG